MAKDTRAENSKVWSELISYVERTKVLNFDSSNSCTRLVFSHLHESQESKLPFVSRIYRIYTSTYLFVLNFWLFWSYILPCICTRCMYMNMRILINYIFGQITYIPGVFFRSISPEGPNNPAVVGTWLSSSTETAPVQSPCSGALDIAGGQRRPYFICLKHNTSSELGIVGKKYIAMHWSPRYIYWRKLVEGSSILISTVLASRS